MEKLGLQQLVQELPKRTFVDLVGQPSPNEEDFEEPMNVASSDDELHKDFLSGEEFASTPDDSEVPKDPQMTYQSRSASSHAETPAVTTPGFAHSYTTTHCSTVIDVATINDTTNSLTITYGIISRADVSVSSNEASFGTDSSAGVETNECW